MVRVSNAFMVWGR